MDLAAVEQKLQDMASNRVKVAVTDIDGVLRGKYMHKDRLLSALHGGFGFCSGVFGWDVADTLYDNSSFTNWDTGYADVQARLDPATYRLVPWDGEVPFLLADFVDALGEPLAICPRNILKRILKRAEALGVEVMCGMEFEWYNFHETPQTLDAKGYIRPDPISPGMFGYSLLRTAQNQAYVQALFEELAAFDIPLEGLHTENGPGVFEAAILYGDALQTADRAVLFKSAVKEIGQRFGIMPCFMAKWNPAYQGCSGHIHQSLRRDGHNLFYDPAGRHGMSTLFESYVAGQLHCLRDFLPLFAPTVNSYKRLVDGHWAPVRANWGIDNRTVSLRVLLASAKSTRVETRNPGSDVNPYLAMAACIAGGLYGVERGLTLDTPPLSMPPRLPRTLGEAAAGFAGSDIARDFFGTGFVDHYAETRDWEWRQFLNAVTDWETQRYFEII